MPNELGTLAGGVGTAAASTVNPALLIPALVKGGYDTYRFITAQKNIQALKQKPIPRFGQNVGALGENKRMYEQQFRQGMTPASKALAIQNFAGSQAGEIRAAGDMSGGQLSTAISRLGSLGNANFALNLAAQNEAIQNQARAGIAATNLQLQSRADRDVQNQYGELQSAKTQYGTAASEAAMGMQNAIGGYFMGRLNLDQAEKNRQALRDAGALGVNNENNVSMLGGYRNSPLVQTYGPKTAADYYGGSNDWNAGYTPKSTLLKK